MSKTRGTARGVLFNWGALAISFAVAFFMSPFIVHHLGVVAYGVWALVVGITSYMGLLDFGLRGAVIRFVSRYHPIGNHAESSEAASAALWLRQWICLVVISLSLLLSFLINHLFHIPLELQVAARWAILFSGLSFVVTLYFGVFGGVLAALHRFDLISGVSIGQTLFRSGGVLWLLWHGHGILALAIWELTVVLAGNLIQTWLCFRVYPELKIFFRYPGKKVLQDFAGYSFWVFLQHIFGQVIYYTDNLVVGAFVSVSAVTYFSISGSLIEYLRTIVASLTVTFLPLASNFEASGEHEKLRGLLRQGTRIAILVAWPIQIALLFRGETFIRLWMGAQYQHISGRVMQILLLSQLVTVANSTSINITLGLAKHRRTTYWAAGEAAVNFILSIFLARRIGIYGVAIGTVIPSLFVHLFLWPRYICKIVGVSVKEHLLQSWLKPVLAVVPFGIACYLSDRYWPSNRLIGFFLQIFAILPIYVATVALSFRKDILEQLRARTKWFARPPVTAGQD